MKYPVPAPYALYRDVPASEIIRFAARVTRTSTPEIMGAAKHRSIVQVRWAIIYALRRQGKSVSEIGRIMKRDHTSVLYAFSRIDTLRKVDDHLDALCNVLAKHAGVAA
jgi:chromosomal replication initiation ATPase DnaA